MTLREWYGKVRKKFKREERVVEQGAAERNAPDGQDHGDNENKEVRRHTLADVMAAAGVLVGKTTQLARPLSSLPMLRPARSFVVERATIPPRPQRPPPELCPSPILNPDPEDMLIPIVSFNFPHPIIVLSPPKKPKEIEDDCGVPF